MDDEQAFKEAVISMGDLSGLVDDMRKLGQDTAKQSGYSTMTARISTAGIVAGVLLGLFGMFISAIVYFQDYSAGDATGTGIFIVAGGALFFIVIVDKRVSKKLSINHKKWWLIIHVGFVIIYFSGLLGPLLITNMTTTKIIDKEQIYAAHLLSKFCD